MDQTGEAQGSSLASGKIRPCCLLLVTGGVDLNDNTLQDAWILDVKSERWKEVSGDMHMNVEWFN